MSHDLCPCHVLDQRELTVVSMYEQLLVLYLIIIVYLFSRVVFSKIIGDIKNMFFL